MEQVITIGLDLAKNVYYVSRARDFSGRWASYLARYRSQDRLSSWLVRLCVKSRRFVTSGRWRSACRAEINPGGKFTAGFLR
jgi:hypothetical protein